jgi:hypothetical protein
MRVARYSHTSHDAVERQSCFSDSLSNVLMFSTELADALSRILFAPQSSSLSCAFASTSAKPGLPAKLQATTRSQFGVFARATMKQPPAGKLPPTVDACRYLGALIVGALQGAGKEELLGEYYAPLEGYWEDNPLSPKSTKWPPVLSNAAILQKFEAEAMS